MSPESVVSPSEVNGLPDPPSHGKRKSQSQSSRPGNGSGSGGNGNGDGDRGGELDFDALAKRFEMLKKGK